MSKQERDNVLELIERGSFKQATQSVAKLARQFPSATYFKVLEQYVRFRQNPGKYSYEKGLAPIVEAQSPPNDPKSLELLHTFLVELRMYGLALAVYEKAMKKYPTFENAYHWFVKALDDMNFGHMGRAALQLPRFSSDPRSLTLWHAVATVALFKYQRSGLSQQELKLLPHLAYKSVDGLRPLVTDQERIVFCHVCELFGSDRSREIVDELLPALFKEEQSSVDLYLKSFLVDHLKRLGDDANMFKSCEKLLVYFDDFELLKELIRSGKSVGKSRDELVQQLELRSSRNYRLARLELDMVFGGVGGIADGALRQYLERFHNKPCCSVDLSHYCKSGHLSVERILAGMDEFPQDLIHDCNKRKISSFLSSSVDIQGYTNLFAQYKHTLKEKPKTDYSSCAYFILQIVQSLVSDERLSLENVVASIAILENYQAQDPYNYDTRVWLIVCYCYLGLANEAYGHYKELKVKNVQNDIVDHLLYTRFSTMFPNKNHAYIREVVNQEKIYESMENVPQYIRIAFEKKSFSKILGMLEFNDRLVRSSMRWIKVVENLQLTRVLNDKRGAAMKQLHEYLRQAEMHNLAFENKGGLDVAWQDNRDFSVLSQDGCDSGSGSGSSSSSVTGYMSVSNDWITLCCVRELMIELVALGESSATVDEYLQKADTSFVHKNMSAVESWSFQVFRYLYENGADHKELIGVLREMPEARGTDTWLLNHSYLGLLTTFKTLDNLKKIKDKEVRALIKNKLRDLRGSCDEMFQEYAEKVLKCKNSIDLALLAGLGYTHEATVDRIVAAIKDTSKTVRNL